MKRHRIFSTSAVSIPEFPKFFHQTKLMEKSYNMLHLESLRSQNKIISLCTCYGMWQSHLGLDQHVRCVVVHVHDFGRYFLSPCCYLQYHLTIATPSSWKQKKNLVSYVYSSFHMFSSDPVNQMAASCSLMLLISILRKSHLICHDIKISLYFILLSWLQNL